jgi:hypothetical protein
MTILPEILIPQLYNNYIVSRVQMKSWAEQALEKLNRLEQCKI